MLLQPASSSLKRPLTPNEPSGSAGVRWGLSSAGRAPAWHAGGQRFDPARLHHSLPIERQLKKSVRGTDLRLANAAAAAFFVLSPLRFAPRWIALRAAPVRFAKKSIRWIDFRMKMPRQGLHRMIPFRTPFLTWIALRAARQRQPLWLVQGWRSGLSIPAIENFRRAARERRHLQTRFSGKLIKNGEKYAYADATGCRSRHP